MKFLFLILFYSSLSFSFGPLKFCKGQKNLTRAEQLASLGPNFDLKLFNLELFSTDNLFFKYEYDVGAAYTKGLYKRVDKWVFGSKANPLNHTNYNLGVDAQVESTFIRFKKDPCEAMLSRPYTPYHIPLKANVAIGPDFKIGDYFLFRGSAGFTIGSEILEMIGHTTMGVNLSGNYLIQGFYQLHIVRLDEKHIRLKVLGHNGKNLSGSLGLGFKNQIEIFKIDEINNQLERVVNLKPIEFKMNHIRSNVFMVDYVLDLSDPEVISAFHTLILSAKGFKNIELTGILKKEVILENNLILDISALEKLFKNDFDNNSIGRIRRNLKTSAKQQTVSFNLDIGNRVIGHQSNRERSFSFITVKKPAETSDNFVLRSWDSVSNGHLFFDFNREERSESLTALFEADSDFLIKSPINFVKNINLKDNRFTFSELLDLKLMVKKLLPLEIFNSIQWDKWGQSDGMKYSNLGFRLNLMMSPESIKEAPELSIDAIKILFREQMRLKGLSESDYVFENTDIEKTELNSDSMFSIRLHQMAKNLSKLLERKIPIEERLKYITKLQRNSLFTQSGLGFLMSLNPSEMSRLYHLDFNLTSNESGLDFTFGETELSDLYKKLLSIKAALDDDAFDPLREAESLSTGKEYIFM